MKTSNFMSEFYFFKLKFGDFSVLNYIFKALPIPNLTISKFEIFKELIELNHHSSILKSNKGSSLPIS